MINDRKYLRRIESKFMALFAQDFITCPLIGRENLLLFNCFYCCACAVFCYFHFALHIQWATVQLIRPMWRGLKGINCNNKHRATCAQKVLVGHFAPMTKRDSHFVTPISQAFGYRFFFSFFLLIRVFQQTHLIEPLNRLVFVETLTLWFKFPCEHCLSTEKTKLFS